MSPSPPLESDSVICEITISQISCAITVAEAPPPPPPNSDTVICSITIDQLGCSITVRGPADRVGWILSF